MTATLTMTITTEGITMCLTPTEGKEKGREMERAHVDDGQSATWMLPLVDEMCRNVGISPRDITDVHVETVPAREHATITRVARSIAAGLAVVGSGAQNS